MSKTNFKPTGYKTICKWGGYQIEIADSGDAARIMDISCRLGRWANIRYTARGRAYVMFHRTREYLDEYMTF